MSSSAIGASLISPLRTPRERACPRPTIFRAPSALSSPTTAQTLEVPISNPTIMEEGGSNMLFPGVQWFWGLNRRGGNGAGFQPTRREVVGDGQVQSGNRSSQFLSHQVNLMPAIQLPVKITWPEGNGAALSGGGHYNFR